MEGYRAPTGTAPAGGAPSVSYTPLSAANPVTRTAAPASTVLRDGSIQPVTYLLRGYVGGILPPQGLEAFTKEVRATSTDVWNLYSHWIRFQTEDIFRFGREILDIVTDGTASAPHAATAPARRIKVTVANGNGDGHAEPAAEAPGDTSQA
jgi:hypothetical protein